MKGAPASFEAGAPFMQEPEPEVPVFPDRTPPASAAPQSARHCAAHAVSGATVPTAGAPLSRDGGARPAIPAFGGILRGRIGRPKGLHGRPLLTRGYGGSACAGRPGCRGGTGGAASPAVPESCGGEESLRDRRSTPPAPFRRHAERPASRRCGGPASYSRHLRRREKGLGKGVAAGLHGAGPGPISIYSAATCKAP